MRELSISSAWDETKAVLRRDGKLFASVALALIILPSTITGLLDPRASPQEDSPFWFDVVMIVSSFISLAGQLAMIRLALAPSTTVGDAIRHGFQRLPTYVVSLIVLLLGLIVLMIPFVAVGLGVGVAFERGAAAMMSGTGLILLVLIMALAVAAGARFTAAMPVASAERAGPITILKRSWELTRGHWLKLLGFLVLTLFVAVLALGALALMAGVVIKLLFGTVDPMSVAKLFEALIGAILTGAFTAVFTVLLARIYVQLSGRESVEGAAAA